MSWNSRHGTQMGFCYCEGGYHIIKEGKFPSTLQKHFKAQSALSNKKRIEAICRKITKR